MNICKTEMIREVVKENIQYTNKQIKERVWSKYGIRVGSNEVINSVGSPSFRFYVDAVKTGTSIPHISGSQIKSCEFICPPIGDDQVFHAFERLIEPSTHRMDVNMAESTTLANLRDTLLPKLLSGELRVKDAEKAVSAAL